MRKISFVWSCFVMTFFVACQQAEVENPKADDLRMSIVASINGQSESPESRYTGTDPSNVVFKDKDKIGVFIDSKPADAWIFDGEDWTSVDKIIYWPSRTKTHTFRAFYPYAEADTYTEVPMPSLQEQDGTIESISKCDFLVTTKEQSYSEGGTVTFNKEDEENNYSFKHVFTLLKLNFQQGEGLSGATLNKITFKGTNIVAPSTYSFQTNQVTLVPDGNSDALTTDGLSKDLTGGQTFYFIVNEKQDIESASPITLAVEYTVNGKTYEAKAANLGNNLFEGGACQTYTITIKNDVLVITGATIAPWGEGDDFPDISINGEEKPASV
ncbi:MAG: fimbrillin family protein [Bacteroides sp.]|nr:fimbrillin family protein [Bacteroides sp.]MBQ8888943.1 fimbrillin family protein [Bacteroidaceae bacterium]